MGKLISVLLEWVFFLGLMGSLVDLTREMRDKAATAHSVGLVSLGCLNRALQATPRSGQFVSKNSVKKD